MKRKFIQCSTLVNRDAVKRVSVDGVEHIIVSSSTLPDDIVMNGGLYPASEIEASFATLERTLAPVEHPSDSHGNFLSATDPIAITNFHAGAHNENVRREGGRVHIDKVINVQEALKSEKGKRLLDRIEELETNESPRSIHTSVGVFLEVEELEQAKTNAAGDSYKWVARNMVFDHDAILLDNVGAATPEKGVGMAVNADGVEFEVDQVVLDGGGYNDKTGRTPTDHRTNAEGISFRHIEEGLNQAIRGTVASEWMYVVDVFDGKCIFETNQGFFEVPWTMRDGTNVELAGIPIRVDRQVTYQPKVNSNQGGNDPMFKEFMLNALKKAGIDTEGLTEDQMIVDAYEAHLEANAAKPPETTADGSTELAEIVANAVAPLTEKITALEGKLNSADEAELTRLAEICVNSKKYPGTTVEDLTKLGLETLTNMAASCPDAHGVPISFESNSGADGFDVPAEMPA